MKRSEAPKWYLWSTLAFFTFALIVESLYIRFGENPAWYTDYIYFPLVLIFLGITIYLLVKAKNKGFEISVKILAWMVLASYILPMMCGLFGSRNKTLAEYIILFILPATTWLYSIYLLFFKK